MEQLRKLFEYSQQLNSSWDENESIDWSEAESLVEQCKSIPLNDRLQMKPVLELISYAEKNEDWDSGEVGRWPDIVCSEIEALPPAYEYREDGDVWEVFASYKSGSQEWRATTETELLAKTLVEVLNPADLT